MTLFFTTLISLVLLGHTTTTVFRSPAPLEFSQGQSDTSATEAEVSRLNASIVELFKQGKYDDALPLAKRVVELEQKAYGSADARLAVALHNLAEIYLRKRDSKEAERLLQQALAIYAGSPERESLLASNALERLAAVFYERADYPKAASLLERSLAMREKLFGKDDLKVAETLWGLANARASEHRYDLAKPLYVRALTIKEAKLGPADPNTVEAMKNFACVDLLSQPTFRDQGPVLEDEMTPMVKKSYCWVGDLKDDCATAPLAKSQGVVNGQATKLPIPPYTSQAQQGKAQGRVLVAILIDETGQVIKAKAVCGPHPALTAVSLIAARGAKFNPTLINGKPVQTTGVITYNFIGPR